MARKSRMLSKSAFDCSHVKSVKAWAILHDGRNAGRIVANFSDNPNGSVCTLTLHIWRGPLEVMPGTTGQAGGYGYDKFSAAMADALDRVYGLDNESTHVPKGCEWNNPYFAPSEYAAWEALKARKLDTLSYKDGGWKEMHGAGESAVEAFLNAHGYGVIKVL